MKLKVEKIELMVSTCLKCKQWVVMTAVVIDTCRNCGSKDMLHEVFSHIKND